MRVTPADRRRECQFHARLCSWGLRPGPTAMRIVKEQVRSWARRSNVLTKLGSRRRGDLDDDRCAEKEEVVFSNANVLDCTADRSKERQPCRLAEKAG